MNKLFPLLITGIAGFSTMIGNLLLFINPKHENKLLSFSLGLSFCVMFLISVLELIPEGIMLFNMSFGIFAVFIFSLLFLMMGYIIVCLIEKNIENDNKIYKIGLLSMVSLLIHNIPEGIICAITTDTSLQLGLNMSFVILIHNIPEGICISLPVYYATKSKFKAIFMTFISSLGEVVGALIVLLFLGDFMNNLFLSIILIITAGIMITLSLFKVFKEGFKLKEYFTFGIGIVVGICIIILTL